MITAYRPIRRAMWTPLAIAPALLGLALAWAPAARACDMKAVDDELAREAALPPQPQLQAAADPSPNSDPSPNDDSAAKPGSAATASPSAAGSAGQGSQTATAQDAGKPASSTKQTQPETKK